MEWGGGERWLHGVCVGHFWLYTSSRDRKKICVKLHRSGMGVSASSLITNRSYIHPPFPANNDIAVMNWKAARANIFA
jgi:hypothetical protein